MIYFPGFFAVIVSGTSLRETRPTLPCFMNGIDDPVYEQSLISWVQNIHDQMTYFKSRCKELNRTVNFLNVNRTLKRYIDYTECVFSFIVSQYFHHTKH